MAVRVGTVLAGRYEITAPIATGGMGEVWQAKDLTLGRTVAVKILKSEYTGDSNFLIRFRNEARHTAALSHPNIASVYDYGETVDPSDGSEGGQRLAYLVMEFVEGKPLVTILAERGRLTPQQTLDVLGQAGEGLSAAHAAGMVHRDIKPGNLLVRPDGVVKLTDFGIAYARDAAPLTRTGMVVGTAQYLSPEQAQGHVVTAASDVYSLGVLGYECVAGVRPFDGESQVAIALAQINRPPPPMPADVPRPVRALIERALAKDPAARFPDGGAFAAVVRQVAAGGQVAPSTAMTTVLDQDGISTTMIPATDPGAVRGPATAPRTMPPLAAGSVDGDRWSASRWDGDDPDPADRRRRLLMVIGAVVLVLAVAGGLFAAVTAGGDEDRSRTADDDPSATSTAPARTSASDAIAFDVADYVGEDVDDVRSTLAGLGFVDVRQEAATQDQLQAAGVELAAGEVVTASPPAGQLAGDETITLYVAESAYSPDEQDEDQGGGASVSQSPSGGGSTRSTATATLTVTATQTPTASRQSQTPSSATQSSTPPPPAVEPPADEPPAEEPPPEEPPAEEEGGQQAGTNLGAPAGGPGGPLGTP
ncbi:protein kinase domain-containing protein [Modestobacter sp. SYSU DS0875]